MLRMPVNSGCTDRAMLMIVPILNVSKFKLDVQVTDKLFNSLQSCPVEWLVQTHAKSVANVMINRSGLYE